MARNVKNGVVAVLFHRRREPPQKPQLLLAGTPIQYQEEVRYLGVLLDRGLSWKPHLTKIIAQAKKKLLLARNACGKLWGTVPHITRWIYTNVIRPAISYGSLVWHKGCDYQWAQKELNKINRLALMYLSHFRRSTPTAGLEVLFNVMPLDLHVKMEASMALV